MPFEPDQRFQPRPLTEDEVRASIAAYAERTGRIHANFADWMIPLIIRADAENGAFDAVSAMKNYDRQLSADEKRLFGINTRIKVCESVVVTLTPAGLQDVNATLQGVVSAPALARNRQSQQERNTLPGYQQRFTAVEDNRTCAAALALHGQLFVAGNTPELPLQGCDAASCRCTFMSMSPRSIESFRARGIKVIPAAETPVTPPSEAEPGAVPNATTVNDAVSNAMIAIGVIVAIIFFFVFGYAYQSALR